MDDSERLFLARYQPPNLSLSRTFIYARHVTRIIIANKPIRSISKLSHRTKELFNGAASFSWATDIVVSKATSSVRWKQISQLEFPRHDVIPSAETQSCDLYKDFVSPNQLQNQIRLVLLVLADTKIRYH